MKGPETGEIMYDCHVHTAYSHDGKSDLEEYIKALENNPELDAIGFSEHVDFFHLSGGYKSFDYNSYMAGVEKYKKQGYHIFAGAEIGYLHAVSEDIESHLNKADYDYVIFSVHRDTEYSLSTKKDVELLRDPNFFRDKLDMYYNSIDSNMRSVFCDVIGHIGIYKRSFPLEYFRGDYNGKWIKDVEYSLAEALANSDKIVEVNTSGILAELQETMPNYDFLRHYYSSGGRSICLGSDAHRTDDLTRGFKEVLEALKSIGFTYQVTPWNKQEEPLPE